MLTKRIYKILIVLLVIVSSGCTQYKTISEYPGGFLTNNSSLAEEYGDFDQAKVYDGNIYVCDFKNGFWEINLDTLNISRELDGNDYSAVFLSKNNKQIIKGSTVLDLENNTKINIYNYKYVSMIGEYIIAIDNNGQLIAANRYERIILDTDVPNWSDIGIFSDYIVYVSTYRKDNDLSHFENGLMSFCIKNNNTDVVYKGDLIDFIVNNRDVIMLDRGYNLVKLNIDTNQSAKIDSFPISDIQDLYCLEGVLNNMLIYSKNYKLYSLDLDTHENQQLSNNTCIWVCVQGGYIISKEFYDDKNHPFLCLYNSDGVLLKEYE
jgi:hypothetical protein